MSYSTNILAKAIGLFTTIVSVSSVGTQLEVTPYLGKMYGSDLTNSVTDKNISVGSSNHYGVSASWQDTPNGQGQVLLNYTKHDFKANDESKSQSVDVLYIHFNGVAHYRQPQYVTTFSIGLGGARFSSDGGSEISPSFTSALGTRYELSPMSAIVTELRVYASLMQDGDTLFCRDEACLPQYNDALWVQTSISIGYAHKF